MLLHLQSYYTHSLGSFTPCFFICNFITTDLSRSVLWLRFSRLSLVFISSCVSQSRFREAQLLSRDSVHNISRFSLSLSREREREKGVTNRRYRNTRNPWPIIILCSSENLSLLYFNRATRFSCAIEHAFCVTLHLRFFISSYRSHGRGYRIDARFLHCYIDLEFFLFFSLHFSFLFSRLSGCYFERRCRLQ